MTYHPLITRQILHSLPRFAGLCHSERLVANALTLPVAESMDEFRDPVA